MKSTGFLKRNSTLKSYTPLKRGTSQFKKGTFGHYVIHRYDNALKRSRVRKAPMTPKKELDGVISEIVRRSFADSHGMEKCATCPTIKHWRNMQCGHFRRRGHTATRNDFRNLAPQCKDCNENNNGRPDEFAVFIDELYGLGTADELTRLSDTIVHDYNYEQELIKFEALLQTIVEKNNGIEY